LSARLKVADAGERYNAREAPDVSDAFELLESAPNGLARLRELVLSLALRGKLVHQDSRDEPASKLLDRIAVEKEGASRPNRHASEETALIVDDADDEVLPRGWVRTCLSGIGIINPRNDAPDARIASFVQMSSVPVALLEKHKSEPRTWGAIKSGFTHFAEGDVGVAKITPCFENGKSTIFKNLSGGIGAGTTELHVVRPLAGVKPEYLLIFLKSPDFLMPGQAVMTGSAGQKRMSREYFERRALPLPPLAEQVRIVARVEELMKLCDALEENGRLEAEQHARLVSTLFDTLAASDSPKALTENWQRIAQHFDLLLDRPEAVDALEQTILQLAVRGLLVPQDSADESATVLLAQIVETNRGSPSGKAKRSTTLAAAIGEADLGALPTGWVWATLEMIASVGTGTTPSRDNSSYYNPPTIPWVTSSETSHASIERTAQFVSPQALRETSLAVYPVGTLIVAMYGQGKTRGQVTELAIEATTNQACAAIVLRVSDVPHRQFIKLYFEKIYDEIREESAGGAQPNLNVGKVKATIIPLPPLAEQRRIVARVKELRELCAQLSERLVSKSNTQARLAEAFVKSVLASRETRLIK
jgi:type I restriction enzyme S subunit